jgi:8-oxo-dGTP diphosphatase
MQTEADIIKVGAIIFDELRRILISKSRNKDVWFFVGGKLENEETHEQCLKRELMEELGVEVVGSPKFYLESPVELGAGDTQKRTVKIFVYLVEIVGNPKPSSEIESIHWLNIEDFKFKKFPLGSILEVHTIPRLISDGLMR